MRSILRDPGAEVVVSTASFAISFAAIGLALAALQDPKQVYINIAFGISTVLLLAALCFSIILACQRSKTNRHIRQIGRFLRQGRELRGKLLSVRTMPEWTKEMQGKVPQWKAEVQSWLDDNLPAYAPQFDLESSITTMNTIGVNSEAGCAAEHLESRMSNLKEILHDIRM